MPVLSMSVKTLLQVLLSPCRVKRRPISALSCPRVLLLTRPYEKGKAPLLSLLPPPPFLTFLSESLDSLHTSLWAYCAQTLLRLRIVSKALTPLLLPLPALVRDHALCLPFSVMRCTWRQRIPLLHCNKD